MILQSHQQRCQGIGCAQRDHCERYLQLERDAQGSPVTPQPMTRGWVTLSTGFYCPYIIPTLEADAVDPYLQTR